MKNFVCCFFGHRKITETEVLKSQFNDLCREIVTVLKEKYPYIKRVYVRAEYPYISEIYKAYLLKNYDDTYFPEKIINFGKAVYVERNYEMINKSSYCIVYCEKDYIQKAQKSGTKIALQYANKQKKQIFLFP